MRSSCALFALLLISFPLQAGCGTSSSSTFDGGGGSDDSGLSDGAGSSGDDGGSMFAGTDSGMTGSCPGATTCAKQGADCGVIGDGCGHTLNCGPCGGSEHCGGGGPNVCGIGDGGTACTAGTCGAGQCGPVADGCGGLLDCGTCDLPETCGGVAASQCGVPASCTNLCLKQVTCPNSGTTSVSGTVYAPNGVDPLPNVLVYVPNGTVQAFMRGVSCENCSAGVTGDPLVSAISGPDGTFTITNMPVGTDIPLVVQTGRWRIQGTIPSVAACVTTPLPASLTTLPSTHAQGDIPYMAFATGSVDSLECVMRKIGVADTEFTLPSGSGHVNLYEGDGSVSSQNPKATYQLGGATLGAGTPSETTLVGDPTTLALYDMLFFPCQGAEYDRTATEQGNIIDYANKGRPHLRDALQLRLAAELAARRGGHAVPGHRAVGRRPLRPVHVPGPVSHGARGPAGPDGLHQHVLPEGAHARDVAEGHRRLDDARADLDRHAQDGHLLGDAVHARVHARLVEPVRGRRLRHRLSVAALDAHRGRADRRVADALHVQHARRHAGRVAVRARALRRLPRREHRVRQLSAGEHGPQLRPGEHERQLLRADLPERVRGGADDAAGEAPRVHDLRPRLVRDARRADLHQDDVHGAEHRVRAGRRRVRGHARLRDVHGARDVRRRRAEPVRDALVHLGVVHVLRPRYLREPRLRLRPRRRRLQRPPPVRHVHPAADVRRRREEQRVRRRHVLNGRQASANRPRLTNAPTPLLPTYCPSWATPFP